jgi:hypothetical protein
MILIIACFKLEERWFAQLEINNSKKFSLKNLFSLGVKFSFIRE